MKKKLSFIVKSLHPIHSRQLSERLIGPSLLFYFSFVLVGLFLMLGIFIGLNWDETFSLSELSTENQIVLVERPLVTIDPLINESESFLAFSSQEFYYPQFVFFGQKTTDYTNQLTLLILPGIVLIIGIISVFFSLLIALISSLFAYVLSRKKKNELSFRDLFVINIHYQAPVLLLFFVLYPFWNAAFLIVLLYLFNYCFGVLLLSNKKFKTIDL